MIRLQMGGTTASLLSLVVLFSIFVSAASADRYTLVDNYTGEGLFSNFTFFTEPDPTEGFVRYLGEAEARDAGLIGVMKGLDGDPVVYMGVDHTHPTPMGRPSVRITSKMTYNKGLFIADFAHVPGTACGSWPAFWMLGPDWPNGGEIDIYEGVNLDYLNGMTLHTGPNCSIMPQLGRYSGTMESKNCDVKAPGQDSNKGCQIMSRNPLSFGTGFNVAGGGVFVTELTDEAISIWFFPRMFGIPWDIQYGVPQPRRWGFPEAVFTGGDCHFDKSFADLGFVFDTTFCGVWAGRVWDLSPCSAIASTCEEFVEKHPAEFKESYWEVKSLKVYQFED